MKDHAAARGAQHLKMLQAALRELSAEMVRLEERRRELDRKAAELERERVAEHRRAVVLRELRRVPGIGPALAREIVDACFDGTLESLARAAAQVPGIGTRRQEAIVAWIEEMKLRLSTLLEEPSPEKERIDTAYEEKRRRLERRMARLEKEIEGLEALRRRAEEEVRKLAAVTPEHFVRAYRGDEVAREVVERYLIGIHPEWEEPPDWFTELTERFG